MSHLTLPACRWRTPGVCRGRQGCSSTIVGMPEFGVVDAQCYMCPVADHRDPTAVAMVLPQAASVRHLLYHLYPVSEVWRWNVAQLRQRISLFNGRRIVSVAFGPGTAAEGEVEDAFRGMHVEILKVANDPILREMASYPGLLARLERYSSPADCTYYGHAKGVTTEAIHGGVRQWTTSMYEALLDYWPACQRELVDHACVGIWRRDWPRAHGGRSMWHYSGSHRWMRNADLYNRDWRDIEQTWVGSETHPGILWTVPESSCLYGAFSTRDLGLYQKHVWDETATAQRAAWLAEHVADRHSAVLVTVILTAAFQRELVHEAIDSVRRQTTDSWRLLIVDAGVLAAEGAYQRYADDARISVMTTDETAEQRSAIGIQAWAINEAWRRGLVAGDLVAHLCDDDVFDPGWLAAAIKASKDHPDQAAWYGPADRQSVDALGRIKLFPRLATIGVAGDGRTLDCRVDGMQLVHRSGVRADWPERKDVAFHADGLWMDAVGSKTAIHPLPDLVGLHRHTPSSQFTKG